MQVFLVQKLTQKQAILPPTEAQHCLKVLRHAIGDELMAIDGQGTAYRVRLARQEGKEAYVDILEILPQWGESGKEIHLYASPLRLRDRFEWLVEKAVELGVTHLHPIRCARTDRYKAKFKPERLQTLLKTATKQTKRSRIPALAPLTDFEEALSTAHAPLRILAHCEASTPLQALNSQLAAQTTLELWIGPEGDFTPEEIALAEGRGLQSVHLGTQRLRTETAAVYASAWAKVIWGF